MFSVYWTASIAGRLLWCSGTPIEYPAFQLAVSGTSRRNLGWAAGGSEWLIWFPAFRRWKWGGDDRRGARGTFRLFALGDPARRRILLGMADGTPRTATVVARFSGKRFDATIKHLLFLRNAGLLVSKADSNDGRREA